MTTGQPHARVTRAWQLYVRLDGETDLRLDLTPPPTYPSLQHVLDRIKRDLRTRLVFIG